MTWTLIRGLIAAVVVIIVTELADRYPRMGGFVLSLPVVSLIAFVATWTKHHEISVISRLSRETVVLVLIGLPFFLPLAAAGRLGLGFWWAYISGLVLASISIGLWLRFGPASL